MADDYGIHPDHRNCVRHLFNLLYRLGIDKDNDYYPTFSELNWYILRTRKRLESDSII